MSSLKEIKTRISSVKSTLKITSAMKLVASSKLRKAQRAIENLRPYEQTLSEILSRVSSGEVFDGEVSSEAGVAVVAISSNSSLCGAFNGNVIRKALEVVSACDSVDVYSFGRKMADAMRKSGHASMGDYTDIVAHPSYDACSAVAKKICEAYFEGRYSKVVLVYNHFVSTSKQEVVVETYLPFSVASVASGPCSEDEFIVEPSVSEVLEGIMPQVLVLKFFAAVLDSQAAEHAARTVAMQTATDNAQDLLSDLTLEYNKGRQQKITAEILDIVGGSVR